MITYEYECQSCKHRYETQQRIIEKPIKKCPSCGKNTCERLLFEPVVVSTGPQTLGTLAERNTRKMSKDELEFKRSNDKASNKKANEHLAQQMMPGSKRVVGKEPFYKKNAKATTKEIQKMTPQQTQKYIMEGKK